MTARYFGEWGGVKDVRRDFQIPDKAVLDSQVVMAWYDREAYSGRAYVLFQKGARLYEVSAGHCSCFGLKGQWRPEPVTKKALRLRYLAGTLSWNFPEGARERLRVFLGFLRPGTA